MNFESAQQAAERLGVTIRTIQKWAKEGRIIGAARHGRSWMIPVDFAPDEQVREQSAENGMTLRFKQDDKPIRIAMPLLNSAYPVGQCLEFIGTIEDEDDRAIAMGEYYYFSGQTEKAAEAMEPYQDSSDPSLRYSANLVSFFANFTRGHTHLAMHAFERLQTDLRKGLQTESVPQLHAIGVFTVTASSVLLHLPMEYEVDLRHFVSYLPGGLKLWACYMLAHKAYLEKNYNGSLAMAELAMSISPQLYPIAAIYVHLVAAMDLMSLIRVEEAKAHIGQAWALAQPDGFIEPIGEHHGLLQGLVKIFFRKSYPKEFESIIAITYSFSAGWRKIHSLLSQHEVADNLTTTEFTIAMLYNRGWTAKEIAAHMDISPRTVTYAIRVIYQKLGISGKQELGQFMLA